MHKKNFAKRSSLIFFPKKSFSRYIGISFYRLYLQMFLQSRGLERYMCTSFRLLNRIPQENYIITFTALTQSLLHLYRRFRKSIFRL